MKGGERVPRKFYTIEDLKLFCKTNNFASFSAQQHGAPLIIQSIEAFEAADHSKDGLLEVKLKACHINRNRNNSSISEDTMNAYKSSFKGRPILASIIKTDKDTYEFHSHDITIDKDGNLEYVEQPVGVVSQLKEPYLEYDKDNDKTYLMAEGHIFEDYSKAAEILQRHKTCRCSVEIAVEEMSYNADEDCLSIDAFSFRGITLLGYEQDGETEILEGMEGSRITIDNFSEENNSMFSVNCQDKLIETLEKLNETLSMFAINNVNQEEVSEKMGHFEELLERYGVEREAIDFEFEGMSNEELDTIFEEKFGNTEEVEETVEEVVEEEFEEGSAEELTEEQTDEEPVAEEPVENFVIQYEISHEDVRNALYTLLGAESDEEYYYHWIIEVFDSKFIYQDYTDGRFYRRGYSIDGDNVALGEEITEVFSEWLSQEEKDALATLKAEYAILKKFRDDYDAAEIKAKKDSIFARVEFEVLADNEAFTALKADMDKFTVEEIEFKAKQIFADHVISNGQFALNKSEVETQTKKIGFNYEKKSSKAQAYAGLFDE